MRIRILLVTLMRIRILHFILMRILPGSQLPSKGSESWKSVQRGSYSLHFSLSSANDANPVPSYHLMHIRILPFNFMRIGIRSTSAALFLLLEAALFLFYFSESSPVVSIFFTFLFPFMLDPKLCKNTSTSRMSINIGRISVNTWKNWKKSTEPRALNATLSFEGFS